MKIHSFFFLFVGQQRLVIQELETRVQQLTQESEGLQNSRSKLAKEKVTMISIFTACMCSMLLQHFFFQSTQDFSTKNKKKL